MSANRRTNLVYVPEGVKINSTMYKDLILDPVAKHVGQTMFSNQAWAFQEDGAPAHTSNISQAWIHHEIPDFITKDQWPPSSPDLNPLDFSIWSGLEARLGASAHRSIEALKKSLVREWKNIPQHQLRAAVRAFRPRLKACIFKRGGHFE